MLQIMKACVVFLSPHARSMETQRKLAELRFLFSEVTDVPLRTLPWKLVRIDRTNRSWKTLFDLARLFLRREWQATHHAFQGPEGVTLLFPMNDLFEAYIAALLRRALTPLGLEVVAQGGLRYCLGDWSFDAECQGRVFQTKPDILIRRSGVIVGVLDTKWKKLAADPLDRKHGVGQQDVYQLMAYARLYQCERLMLLYPAAPGQPSGLRKEFGIHAGRERLDIATVDVAAGNDATVAQLRSLAQRVLKQHQVGLAAA
jgi:5-methylcytosine-specific restriction enzyme subunit McrC